MTEIEKNIKSILTELPDSVELVAAAKTRTSEEISEAISAGVNKIGENYVQESLAIIDKIGDKAEWHFIGHLQRNKAKFVVPRYDMVESLDSIRLAKKLNKECKKYNKTLEVLLEINSGREKQKFGILPENTIESAKTISQFENLQIKGLMTMGPFTGDPELSRPFFIETRKLFNQIKTLKLPNVEMKFLSMGMSNSYKIAIEEGANLVRIGTNIFGPRK